MTSVPVVVKDVATQAMLELALVENVVRADLSPLEEAVAYRQLIDEFGLTQANVAERVGRSRVSVTNTLRLLSARKKFSKHSPKGKSPRVTHARCSVCPPASIKWPCSKSCWIALGMSAKPRMQCGAGSPDRSSAK